MAQRTSGRNACEFSNSQGGRWGGPSPVPAGMPTVLVYLQDEMHAKFQNRKLDDGMGLERTNKRTNERTNEVEICKQTR